MSGVPVECAFADGIGRITFNRPQAMNAVDVPTAIGFRDTVHTLLQERGLKVIVIAGVGRAFMAGGDLAAFRSSPVRGAFAHELIAPIHEGLVALSECPAISLSVVQGAAAGAGMSMALATDLCIAGQSATFMAAYSQVAAPGDCGITWTLPQLVGPRKAMELMLLSPTMSAEEAKALGLVNRIVADEALPVEAERIATRLARGPMEAMARIKALIRRPGTTYAAHLDSERESFAVCAADTDFEEALEAFFGKRKPSFRAE